MEVKTFTPLECLNYFYGKEKEARRFLEYTLDKDVIDEWDLTFESDDCIKAYLKMFGLYNNNLSLDDLKNWVLLCSYIALLQDSPHAFKYAIKEYMPEFARIMLDFFTTVSIKQFPSDSVFAGTSVFTYLFQLSNSVHACSDLEHKEIFTKLSQAHLEDNDLLESVIHQYDLMDKFNIKNEVTLH